jgi:hypothetical protein
VLIVTSKNINFTAKSIVFAIKHTAITKKRVN